MILVEQQMIHKSHRHYNDLASMMILSKILYNKGLYNVRQHFFSAKNDSSIKYKYLSYVENWKKLKEDEAFKALDSHCSQEVLKLVDRNFNHSLPLFVRKIKENTMNV